MKYFIIFILILNAVNCATFDSEFSKYSWHMYQVTKYDKVSVDTWKCDSCKYFPLMRDVQFFFNKTSNTGTAFTGYEPSRDLIVFSFKGTHDVKGAILNADFFKINLPNCKDCAVHRGFLYYYENL